MSGPGDAAILGAGPAGTGPAGTGPAGIGPASDGPEAAARGVERPGQEAAGIDAAGTGDEAVRDLAIIGAGPAGMAAAVEARGLGLSVLVLDEQPAPGGQVFRAVEAAAGDPALRGADQAAGLALARRFRACGAEYRPATTLWHLDPEEGGLLSVAAGGATAEIATRRVLLATGAQERPVPIPGWTLPGVMGCGAAQILLKAAGAVPSGRTVIAGQGPLVWLLAVQFARAGAPPALILSTTPRGAARRAAAAAGLGELWAGRALLAKGARLIAEARRRGLRVIHGVTGLRAEGNGRVERILWDGGTAPCDTLLLHEGVIPATHIPLAIGLAHDWDAAQHCWRPRTDAFGATSEARIALAGDGAGIGGWEAAVLAGRLAALDAAHRLGRIGDAERDFRAAPLLLARARALALRPFLDRLYAPPAWVLAPPDDATTVCRCEEVTAGQVRDAARLGATGPNQAKAYLRCGMGPCQGRLCGPTVAALIGEVRGLAPESVGSFRPRAPYKPLTVGELAGMGVG